MKTLKEAINDDLMGFIFWVIFFIIILFEFTHVDYIANAIVDAYRFGILMDFLLLTIVSIGIPTGFAVLTASIWFKK